MCVLFIEALCFEGRERHDAVADGELRPMPWVFPWFDSFSLFTSWIGLWVFGLINGYFQPGRTINLCFDKNLSLVHNARAAKNLVLADQSAQCPNCFQGTIWVLVLYLGLLYKLYLFTKIIRPIVKKKTTFRIVSRPELSSITFAGIELNEIMAVN